MTPSDQIKQFLDENEADFNERLDAVRKRTNRPDLQPDSTFTKLIALCRVFIEPLEYYSATKFNREKMEWMPGNPDKAINAMARAAKIVGK